MIIDREVGGIIRQTTASYDLDYKQYKAYYL